MTTKSRNEIIIELKAKAKRMRKKLLDMALSAGAGSSHIGGGLSIIDITATLYGAVMKYDSKNPEWEERDRFILSKGHGVLGYYTALNDAGVISDEELMQFEKKDTYLLGHPIMNRPKGIEFSTGSLGMGLALGIGVGIAAKRRNKPTKIYVVMGDGECNEGSVWEAAMAAPNFQLDNVVAILDRNHFQQTGSNKDIMSVGDLAAKWRSFGWDVVDLDGHDVGALYDVFMQERTPGKPLAVVAQTVKGKGFSFFENNNDYHHAVLTQAQYDLALAELEGGLK
jgi:transketolase